MYQNGVRTFLAHGDDVVSQLGEEAAEAYHEARFIAPFPFRQGEASRFMQNKIVPISASSAHVAQAAVNKMSLYFEHDHCNMLVPVVDKGSERDWSDIYKVAVDSSNTRIINYTKAVHASDLDLEAFLGRLGRSSKVAVLYLASSGFPAFLNRLEKRNNLHAEPRPAAKITEVFAPRALWEESKFPAKDFGFGIHTWTFMGSSERSEPGRRSLFKALERQLLGGSSGGSSTSSPYCDPTTAFVYDAALVAGKVEEAARIGW
jgi:hypothetical protein